MSHLYVSAHEDDNLVFMSPSLAEDARDHYYLGVFAQEAQRLHRRAHTLRLFIGIPST